MTKAILLGVMTAFVGTKSVLATPMTRGEYNEYRGWQIPENEDPNEQGYLIEYVDGGKPNDERHAGYISWSPADVFERSYKPAKLNSNLSFGEALEHLKKGEKVARLGWNGKGMWLVLVHPDDDANVPPQPTYGVAGIVDDATNGCLPWIGMKTADNKFVPWLASQTDVLAEDWQIVE